MNETIKHRIEQIKRGEVPNGYKKSKLGVLPGDWTSMTVGECLEKVEKPVAVEPDKLYTQIGIRSHGKGLFYKEPVTGESLGNKSVFWVEPDCFVLNIVFAWEQAIGKTTENEIGMIGSHRFPMFRPIDNRVDVDYLIAYLLTKRGTDILEAASPGGAGRNRTLGQDRFMNSKIILPPINEQKKIAEILATQDKVIALKERLLEEKKTQKKYLMQQLLTGKKRLAGFTDRYFAQKMKTIIRETSFRSNDGINRNVMSVSNVKGFVSQTEQFDKIVASNDTSNYKIVKYGTFAYNPSRINVGSLALYKGNQEIIVSPMYSTFIALGNINMDYLLYWFKSFGFTSQLKKYLSGSVRNSLSISDLLLFDIRLPYIEEQNAIVEVLSNADKEISIIQKSIDQEKQKKKALMQLLLTGIVRV